MKTPDRRRGVDPAKRDYIDNYCVETIALSVEHDGGMRYETYIFPADGEKITKWLEVWGTRYATKSEAIEGHDRVCEQLRAGELELYE